MQTVPDEESIVKESFEELLQNMKGTPGPGYPEYDMARHKVEFKLVDLQIRTAREQGDKTAALTRSLVRLNWILVVLTVVLVVIGGAATVLQIIGR